MPFWTVGDAGPYKEKPNFLMRTSAYVGRIFIWIANDASPRGRGGTEGDGEGRKMLQHKQCFFHSTLSPAPQELSQRESRT